MAVTGSDTLVKTPRRKRSVPISPEKRSSTLSREAGAGVTCL
jgi:hypothetical protein